MASCSSEFLEFPDWGFNILDVTLSRNAKALRHNLEVGIFHKCTRGHTTLICQNSRNPFVVAALYFSLEVILVVTVRQIRTSVLGNAC